MRRAISLAVSCVGVLLMLGDVALASECQTSCDGGYLAAMGLVGGGLALGSSALGLRLGGDVTRRVPPPIDGTTR
jgi:hypothetical protein